MHLKDDPISEFFEKRWHKGLLHKLSTSGVPVRDFPIINFFLTDSSLKLDCDGQSHKALPINAYFPRIRFPFQLSLSTLHKRSAYDYTLAFSEYLC